MTNLDADIIRKSASERTQDKLARIDVFAEIDSTNSYLMQKPGPAPGMISIAVTSNQTAGRGRLGKTWQSPPGTGLCLSVAYTFVQHPQNPSALTLALGLGAVTALEELDATGLKLKWPNDLVALDGKLGGILTEIQQPSMGTVTVVAGIGVNVDLRSQLEIESGWAREVVDLHKICESVPRCEKIAGTLTTHLLQAFVEFEESGFGPFAERWPDYDWLFDREVTVDTGRERITGIGAGIAADGALLVDTPDSGLMRVISGSVSLAGGMMR